MRFLSRAAISLTLLASPLFASALTQDELIAQAQALLAQVQALQQQLSSLQQTQSTVQTTTGSTGLCPQIGRSLRRESTGDDVTRLQQFLAQDSAIYPEARVTGYYGALTEQAVQRWQVKFNIVSSGTPETTGYGTVGPRTAAAIAIVCAGGSINGVTGVSAAPVGGFIQVTPVSGSAPLTVKVTATINTTRSCTPAVYTLDYGDGSNPQIVPTLGGNCQEQVATYNHVYQYGGTFKVMLSAAGHQTSATVVVSGSPAPTQTSTGAGSRVQMTGSQFTPRALTITPGTTVVWANNDTVQHNVVADNGSFNTGTLQPGQSYSQIFTLAGSYPYYCSFHGGKGGAGMAGVITVISSANPTPTTPTTPLSLGALSVTPNAGGNPRSVLAQFNSSCSGYTINWGDGTPPLATAADPQCTDTGSPAAITHTYSQNGSFTITLMRGSQIDTAAIVIN